MVISPFYEMVQLGTDSDGGKRSVARRQNGRLRPGSPAIGLEVLNMGMLTHSDIGNHLANIDAVLDDGIAFFHRLDGKFVPDRNVAGRLELDFLVLIHDPAR